MNYNSDNSEQFLSSCPSCQGVVDVTTLEPYSKIICPHCSGAVRVRRVFNHFTIVKQIGEGGMSRVFDAEDSTLGRHVALKILNRHYSKDIQRMLSFEREAQHTAAVAHPNVVKVYSAGRDQGNFYIAMELVSGGSLEQRITDQGRLSEKDCLAVGRAVAEGLRAAYREGLIHRDVKPANILFTDTEVPKIVDFGLAQFHSRDVDDSGEIWATPFYVAPEKVRDNREDFRSDMYSLGASLFHALTGRPPHQANTNSIQELKVIKSKAVKLEDSGLKFSSRTIDLVNCLLEREPENRYKTYDELVEAFRDAESLLGYTKIGRRSRRKQYIYAAIGATVCLTLFAVLVRPPSQPKGTSVDVTDGVSRTDLSELGKTLAAGTTTVSDVFLMARSTLMEGKYADARRMFDEVARSERTRQPTLNWARFNAGLCAMVAGRHRDAERYFQQIKDDVGKGQENVSAELQAFFAELGERMSKNLGLEVDPAKVNYAGTNEQALGMLAQGLAHWHFGDPLTAQKWLSAFNAAVPGRGLEWISSYKKIIEPCLEDLNQVGKLAALKDKPEPYGTINAAREAVTDLQKAISKVKTSGTLRNTLVKQERFAKEEIERLKREEVQTERARIANLRIRETEQLSDLTEAIPALVRGYDFNPVVDLLKGIKFEVPEVQTAFSNKLYVWSKAKEFMDTLIKDVETKGYVGAIPRRTGLPLQGRVTQLDYSHITLVFDRGEFFVPMDNITPEGLIGMAQYFCEQETDSTEYYRRQEVMAIFAKVQKLDQMASMVAGQLMEENRGFRQRWAQVEQNGY